MYLDAEERKAALMSQNRIQNGMMFKMDDNPRIIGSEKKKMANLLELAIF